MARSPPPALGDSVGYVQPGSRNESLRAGDGLRFNGSARGAFGAREVHGQVGGGCSYGCELTLWLAVRRPDPHLARIAVVNLGSRPANSAAAGDQANELKDFVRGDA